MANLTDEEARFLLAHICEPGDLRINKLGGEYSPTEMLQKPQLLPENYQTKLRGLDFTQIVRNFDKQNFIWPAHPDWPTQLNDLGDRKPIGIWFDGNIQSLNPIAIAVVGARSATTYGERVASEISMQLAGLKIDVVSGGAFGIDAAAHHGALVGGGITVAVMAGGVDVLYPKSNSILFGRIKESGVIISEVPPGTIPIRHRFLIRNRLIAALSSATLVVEARVKSGAMSTAGEAAQIGRDVMAIPGSVFSASSAGCHQLIRDGAILVTDVKEICELILGDYPQYCA